MNKPIATSGGARALFFVLQFTWGLPVNLLGLVLFLCCGRCRREAFYNSIVSVLPESRGGLPMGVFIFVSTQNADTSRFCAHEDGQPSNVFFVPCTG